MPKSNKDPAEELRPDFVHLSSAWSLYQIEIKMMVRRVSGNCTSLCPAGCWGIRDEQHKVFIPTWTVGDPQNIDVSVAGQILIQPARNNRCYLLNIY